MAVIPLVTNRGFNQPLMHRVLDTPEARARARGSFEERSKEAARRLRGR